MEWSRNDALDANCVELVRVIQYSSVVFLRKTKNTELVTSLFGIPNNQVMLSRPRFHESRVYWICHTKCSDHKSIFSTVANQIAKLRHFRSTDSDR